MQVIPVQPVPSQRVLCTLDGQNCQIGIYTRGDNSSSESVASLMTLSATLRVAASAPGNFSVPHGLNETPFLIEIVPTSGGAIWAQTPQFDRTNIYLEASDTGVTAMILVWTAVDGGLNSEVEIEPSIFVDLNSNGTDMCLGCLALNEVPLDSCNSHDGFQGNLYFIDTQGNADPQYSGFNTRWFLVYLTAAEVLDTAFVPEIPVNQLSLMTLSATLEVTASAPGNFSVAHGLDVLPFLIEILPTSSGAIWGQPTFADGTNINLVASDTSVTATILVYTVADSNLQFQVPVKTLLASSTSPGDFTVAHGLGEVPTFLEILPTSAGSMWLQPPNYDETYIYLEASDAGVTATITLYDSSDPANLEAPATELTATPSTGGNFSLAHGLKVTPSRIEVLMISAGSIWAQTPAADTTSVYLAASDGGVVAKILVYA